MAVVAQALAELQGTGVRLRRRHRMRDDLAVWRRKVALLSPGNPQLCLGIDGLLSRLEAEALDDASLVPAHGGFRHKQIMGDDRCLTILDWDGLCQAHPALDAATFLARLRRRPIAGPGGAPQLERLAEVFRGEFLSRCRIPRRALAVCEAVVLADLAMRALRRAGRGEQAARVRGLLAAAHERLDASA
jgi:aminoglycoside phosphotransferase (APT) family kinase protein